MQIDIVGFYNSHKKLCQYTGLGALWLVGFFFVHLLFFIPLCFAIGYFACKIYERDDQDEG